MRLALLLPVLASLSLSFAAYTPRIHSRGIQARHAAILKARSPVPAPAPVPAGVPLNKRASKKCRARPSGSSAAPTSTQVAPVNPGNDPSPKPSPTQASPTTTAQHPTQTPPSGGGGGGGGSAPFPGFHVGPNSGDLTYYDLGLTACGKVYNNHEYVAAVSQLLFDAVPGAGANPNNNPICGKKVRVSYHGKSIIVTLVDRCTACKVLDLDLSPDAFSQLADQSVGRVTSGMTWTWV